MPRGAKISIPDTKARKFKEPGSFVSVDGHEYLKGKDKTARYREAVEKLPPFCNKCKRLLYEGDLDHIQGGLVGRCDCMHNLQWLCKDCHREKHVQVQLRSAK